MQAYFRTLLTTVIAIAALSGIAAGSIAFLSPQPLSPLQGEVFSTLLGVFWLSAVAIIGTMSYMARASRSRDRHRGRPSRSSDV
jgi:hypothetical protein